MTVTTKNAVSTPAKFEVGKRYRISPRKVRTITVLKRNPTTIDFCLNGNESKIIRRKFYTDSCYSHDAEIVAYGNSKSPDYFWVVAKDVVDDAEIEQVADTVAETEITEGKPVNEYEIEEAEQAVFEARLIARILANETLKIRYDKAKTQVKYERYENGYCGWYFKGKNRDNWECNVTKATACLTRYGLSRFEFAILSENEPAVIDNNGYDETAFELLPTVDELNDVEVDEPEQVAENHIAEQYQFAAKFADKLFRVERFSDEQINAVIIAVFDGKHDVAAVKKLIDDFKAANFNEAQEVAARLEEIIADEAKRAADKPTPEISEKESLEIDIKILVDEIDEAREALAQAEADSEVPQEHIDNLRDVIDRKLNEYYETYAKLDALNSTPEIKQAADTVTEIQKMQSAFASAIEDSNVDFSATLTINGETLTFEEGQLSEIASTRYGAYCQIRNGRKIFYYRGNRVSKQGFFAHIATEDKATDERAAITQFVAKFGGSEIKPGTNPQANFVAQIHPILANGRQYDYAATFDSKADAHNFIAEFIKTLAGGMKFLATIKRGSFFGEELYRHGLKGQEFFAPETDASKTYTLTIYTDVWTDGDNTFVENYDTCRHLYISGKYLISKHSWKLTRGGKTIATGDGVKDFCHFITCEFDVSERFAEIADVKSASLEICGENIWFRNGKCIFVYSPKYHASFYVEAGIDGNEHYEINKSDERGKFTRFEFITEEEFFNTIERRGGCTVDNGEVEYMGDAQAILNDERNQLIRQRENLNSRLRNGLLTAEEFKADAGEVDAAIRYVELQIDALKAGDTFNYAAAAEHLKNIYGNVLGCIDDWKLEHGLSLEQCEKIYVAAHIDRNFDTDVDRELINRMIDEFKCANAEKFYRETESTFREMKSAVAPARKFMREHIFDIYHFDYALRILNQRGELKACPNKYHLVDTRFDVEVDRCELDYVIYFGSAELARYRTVENVNRAVDQFAIAIANRQFEFTFPEDEPPEIAILSDELDEIGNDICDTKDILERKIAAGAPQSEIKELAEYIAEREGEYYELHKQIYGTEPESYTAAQFDVDAIITAATVNNAYAEIKPTAGNTEFADKMATLTAELDSAQSVYNETCKACEIKHEEYRQACEVVENAEIEVAEKRRAVANFGQACAKDLSEKLFDDVLILSPTMKVTNQDGGTCETNFGQIQIFFHDAYLNFYITTDWIHLGEYSTPAQVETVINKLKAAIERGDSEFKFPTVDELTATEPFRKLSSSVVNPLWSTSA
ncbi:MAG: hypothetical protein IKD80_09405 [Selenomonadaceae bacterium]|nr:hypothetical protein [Selenomonadaceae bacterium]